MKRIISKKDGIYAAKRIAASLLMFLMTLCVSAQAEEPDFGNDCSSAHAIATDGSDTEGVLQDSDEDWFSFTAAADSVYALSHYHQTGYKTFTLYGPEGCEGTLQGITTLGGWPVTATQAVFIQTAGTYYLQAGGEGGMYRISVSVVDSYPGDAYPDTCLNTDTVSLTAGGEPVFDGITNYGMDEDWFTFGTIPFHKYQVSLFYQPVNSDVVYELYESDCGIDLSGSRNSSVTFISLEGADYDLRLHSASFVKDGYYEIEVVDVGTIPTDDYGNGCDAATPIVTNGTQVQGVLQYTSDLVNDEDWFSFTAVADSVYELNFYGQAGYKGLTLYGPDGCGGTLQPISGLQSWGGTVTQDVFIQTAGIYYIQVAAGSGMYRVSVNAAGSYPTDTYPDTCLNTDRVSLAAGGGPVSDGITNFGMDEDWLTFSTAAFHKYQVSLSYQPVNSDVVYELYESSCGVDLSGSRNSVTFVSLEGADYDVRLHSASFARDGYYELEVDDIGTVPTDDYGNSCSLAAPVAANGVLVQGVLQYTSDLVNDEDWFSFTAAADSLYAMTLYSQADYKSFSLYGPGGCSGALQPVFGFDSYGGTAAQDVFIQTAGTYYIQIANGSGMYRISVESSSNPQCGDSNHPYPVGDMTADCVVSLDDFALFAAHWLEDNRP